MPFEHWTKFSALFRPPFEYGTSEYWTSKSLLFRCLCYSDVCYSDHHFCMNLDSLDFMLGQLENHLLLHFCKNPVFGWSVFGSTLNVQQYSTMHNEPRHTQRESADANKNKAMTGQIYQTVLSLVSPMISSASIALQIYCNGRYW